MGQVPGAAGRLQGAPGQVVELRQRHRGPSSGRRVTRFPGRAPPPARPGRGSFLFLPAAVGVGRASGHLPPPPAAGLVRLPGRLRLGRTPPARSRRVEPWSRGLSRAVSLDTGSPARPRGQNLWTPRTPDRLRAAPSRARPWTRPRGPGLAEAAGAGGALLGAEGPAAGGGIPGRGAEEKTSKTQTEGSVKPGPGMQGFAGTPAGAIAPLGFRLARASISLHGGLSKAGSVQRLQRGGGG
nr:uncharacterized protein LOC105475004 [Macaca nemestrina]